MKAISLLQPWATLWCLGIKQFETRSWRTNHVGPLAVHASAGKDKDALELWKLCVKHGYVPASLELTYRAIVGLVYLGPASMLDTNSFSSQWRFQALDRERFFSNFGPDRWAWEPEDRAFLCLPIPCKGALGLWTLPGPVLQELYLQLLPSRFRTLTN